MKIVYQPIDLVLELTQLVNEGHLGAIGAMGYIGELNQNFTQDLELIVKDEGPVMVENSEYFGKRRVSITQKGEGRAFYL